MISRGARLHCHKKVHDGGSAGRGRLAYAQQSIEDGKAKAKPVVERELTFHLRK